VTVPGTNRRDEVRIPADDARTKVLSASGQRNRSSGTSSIARFRELRAMTRITLLLIAAACGLSACATPSQRPSSALDAVDAPRSSVRRDCRRPTPGIVCVREVRPDSNGQCVCLAADQLHSLGIWPDSSRLP
jgi:hypothetical protein